MASKDAKRKSANQFVDIEALRKRLIDLDGVSDEEALDWAFLYTVLAPGDEDGYISVRMIRQFMEERVKANNPVKYKKIVELLRVKNAEAIWTNPKLKNKVDEDLSYLENLRTVDNAYKYSKNIHDAMDAIAPKLDAPEDMDTITRVKWLRLWMVIIRDQTFFWADMTSTGKVVEDSKFTGKVNERYLYPESLIGLYKYYFSDFEDGSFVFELIKILVDLSPATAQGDIYRFAELSKNRADNLKLSHIRENVKKSLFPEQWVSASDFFFNKKWMRKITPDVLKSAVEVWNNGGVDKLPKRIAPRYDSYTTTKKRFTVFQIGETQIGKDVSGIYVSCQLELDMMVEVYKWLEHHEDFRFGREEKTLSEYGMCGLVKEPAPPMEECIAKWILEMGFANSKEDINWDIANQIFLPETYEKMMVEYFEGNITADAIFKKTGIKDRSQAIACFSIVTNMGKNEKDRMGQSLKRVKMFGEENALPHDIIYLTLFRYMMNNRKEDIPMQIAKQYASLAS